MRARDLDPINAKVPQGTVSGTRIYFDPFRLADVFPDDKVDETREGFWGVRAMIVTPDGTVYHYMNAHGARRRVSDFQDAIEAGEHGLYTQLPRVRAILDELNPNGRVF